MVRAVVWRARLHIKPARVLGISHDRSCNICAYSGHFRYYGAHPTIDTLCPQCRSVGRHRLLWSWLDDRVFSIERPILHFSPEPAIAAELSKRYGKDYVTADLYRSGSDLVLDIERIDLPTGSYGSVICNHVLEHVDDEKALSEILRILRDGGKLVCSVPINFGLEETYENSDLVEDSLRDMHFGQAGHVRQYGADFSRRLQDSGFVTVERVTLGPKTSIELGVELGDSVFRCP